MLNRRSALTGIFGTNTALGLIAQQLKSDGNKYLIIAEGKGLSLRDLEIFVRVFNTPGSFRIIDLTGRDG